MYTTRVVLSRVISFSYVCICANRARRPEEQSTRQTSTVGQSNPLIAWNGTKKQCFRLPAVVLRWTRYRADDPLRGGNPLGNCFDNLSLRAATFNVPSGNRAFEQIHKTTNPFFFGGNIARTKILKGVLESFRVQDKQFHHCDNIPCTFFETVSSNRVGTVNLPKSSVDTTGSSQK